MINNNYTHNPTVLILGSGGAKGYSMLGSMIILSKLNLLKNVKTFVGVSIGTVICFLHVIGCSVLEIIELSLSIDILDILSNLTVSSFTSFNLFNGFLSHDIFRSKLSNKIIEKFGFIPTFKELYDLTKLNFVSTVVNLDTSKEEFFSHLSTPNLNVVEGVLMSMNIPILFQQYQYNNTFYVDGGILNPLPFEYFDDGSTDIICVSLNETEINPHLSSKNYLLKVIKLLTSKTIVKNFSHRSDRCILINLFDDIREPMGLNITFDSKIKMIINGYISSYITLKNFFPINQDIISPDFFYKN
jgi:predicted acylesterase/phospholipase RssA